MAYRKVIYVRSTLNGIEKLEGETLEQKIERVVDGGEPIEDGAPEIFTDRRDGVGQAYNIRTDRWEVACDAMNSIHRFEPKRDNVGEKPEMKVVKDEPEVGGESEPKGA